MKKTMKLLLILFCFVIMFLCAFIGYRYIKNYPIMGKYEIVEGEGEKYLNINLITWSEGKKEDLNCDLWNCNGYNHGTYEIKGNKIEFHNNKKSYISYEFEVKKEINQTYLILKEKNYYGTTITKYKKAN